MTFWKRIFQRHPPPRYEVPPVGLNRPLRDALARAAHDGGSAQSVSAVYRALLDAGCVYLAILEGSVTRLGTFKTGPGDNVKLATAQFPDVGQVIIMHPDLRSAARQAEGGNLGGITLSEAAQMATRLNKPLLLTNLES